jgi:hypothetical protein
VAYPFGNHPTLKSYVEWCSSQRCTMHSALVRIDEKMVTCHRLVNPANGRHVVIAGKMTDILVPTMVAWLDRRLGLSSPFSKVGDGTYQPGGFSGPSIPSTGDSDDTPEPNE